MTYPAIEAVHVVGLFVFLYPVTLSVVWVIGGLYFWWRREFRVPEQSCPELWPPVTILVPCHNEAIGISATCQSLSSLNYPDYRVVFIDDASTDNTVEIIRSWVNEVPYFHLLRLTHNQGKARALNCALNAAVNTPLTLVVDADTLLTPDAVKWLVAPFTRQPRLGAITGNPLVYNRSNLLEKMQAAEFASIIGLIKRSQRTLGRILTVSGCVVAFRTEILRRVGGFSVRSATEDIDMTWLIQRQFHEIWFEPRAVAFIQSPSKMKEFWKQRCRWALGGWHLLRTHKDVFTRWRYRRLWPVYIDFVLSYLWSFCFVLGIVVWCITSLLLNDPIGISPVPVWYGAILSLTCLVQFGAALLTNHHYDRNLWRTFFWVPWYPIFFFCLNGLAVVRTAPGGLFGRMDAAGRWNSPERGEVTASALNLHKSQ